MSNNSLKERLKEINNEIEKLSKLGNLKESLKYYKKLVELLENSLEIDKTFINLLIEILNRYGGALRYTGYYKESEKAFIKAKELIKVNYGKDNENYGTYGTTLNNLAGLYRLMGRLNEAIKLFNEVKIIYESTVGNDNFLYASLCNNLALVYQDKGDF